MLAGPLIKYFKSNGCTVIHKCTTIRHAKVGRVIDFREEMFSNFFFPARALRNLVSISLVSTDLNVGGSPGIAMLFSNLFLGAGHPGEDDIGGLVLVRASDDNWCFPLISCVFSFSCSFLVGSCYQGTQGALHCIWRCCRRTRICCCSCFGSFREFFCNLIRNDSANSGI